MTRLILVLFTLYICCQVLQAHSGAVAGTVADHRSGTPLALVNIVLEGTDLGRATDSTGSFILQEVPTGTYFITASYIGYKIQSKRITVLADKTVPIHFQLVQDVLQFPEITSEMPRQYSAASSSVLRAIDFVLRPKESSQDILSAVPGVVIAQHAGGGKAEQIFVRGFDCDHGTDMRITVDGVPVNMVSHAHGQGYADLHFVIPEVVQGLNVQKGPYFAEKGDFATGGSINFSTLNRLDHNTVSVEAGMFGYNRVLALLQVPFSQPQITSYFATEFVHTNGYFQSPQHFNRYNLFGKLSLETDDRSLFSLSLSGFGSGWDASGQIPDRAIRTSYMTDRYGAIDDAEGGATQRRTLNFSYQTPFTNGSQVQAHMYLVDYRFRLFSNFTFWANDPVNGDQIEQADKRTLMGYHCQQVSRGTLGAFKTLTTIGSEFRSDFINLELWHTKERQRLDIMVNGHIHQKSMALFAKEEIILSPRLRFEAGLRSDYFTFDVEDQQQDTLYVIGEGRVADNEDYSGLRQGVLLSPKFNLVYAPLKNWQLYVNVGQGFHSNDARAVVQTRDLPLLPRAVGWEVGSTFHLFKRTVLSAALWQLNLESELVYVGDEGTTEISGRTHREGIDLVLRQQLAFWLWSDIDIIFSRGRFLDAPEGENHIPLAPTLSSTGGLTVHHPSGIEGSLRYRYVGDRPANEDNSITALGYFLADLGVSYRLNNWQIGLEVENLLDAEWNEAQFDTESFLPGIDAVAVSELHYTPGTPRSVKVRLLMNF